MNADNQVAITGITFDGNGNPTTYKAATFSFDPEDRLTAISSPAFSAAYDGDGLRAKKTAAGVTTYFVYDGSTPIAEETFNGTAATFAALNAVTADGWRARKQGGIVYQFVYDPQGSVQQRHTDGSYTGGFAAYDRSTFEGYGALRQANKGSTGAIVGQHDPAGFGGQFGYYTDTETGLLCLTHRYYDPGTGKFLNRDPIGYAGGANLYGFCGGNPVNGSDPDGTSNDPMPGAGPDWVRVSTSLFIPMPEFVSAHPDGGIVTNAGDGRSFDYNTDRDRVRVDFALNVRTGQLITYPAHTAGSTMTTYNGLVAKDNASMLGWVTSRKSKTGWIVSIHAQGADPFYVFGPLQAPNASCTVRFNIDGRKVGGSAHFRQFPSIESYAYNSTYQNGHQFLFGYQPSGFVQHGPGVVNLTWGEYKHKKF